MNLLPLGSAPFDVRGNDNVDLPENLLTLRELECVRLLAVGMTDKDIQHILNISRATVQFHVDNVKRKLGARNRVHIICILAKAGLV